LFPEIRKLLAELPASEQRNIAEELDWAEESMDLFVGHIVRSHHQRKVISKLVHGLPEHRCLIRLDFKMKFTPVKFREDQQSWFGKKGEPVYSYSYVCML